MSKSIHEIIKESLIDELNANHIKTDDLVKIVEDIKGGFDSVLEELMKKSELSFGLGDEYWVVGGDGEKDRQQWDGYPYDKIALENNAIFKTQEEAEFEAERLKVLRELEKLGRAFKPFHGNYMIIFSHDGGLTINGYRTTAVSYGKYYFDNREEAKQAVEKVGEDRIKKYLFRVEE